MSWRDRVRASLRPMRAYHVPPVTVEVKLDANESPFAPPPAYLDALAESVKGAPLHRYPDPRATKLRALVADDLGVAPDELVLGNGGDELIALVCQTFAEPPTGRARAALVYPAPSFVVFRIAATAAGMDVVEAPLGPRHAADPDALDAAIARANPNVVFVATPNNPTGTVWPRAAVEDLIAKHRDVVFVVDQAYVVYGGEDMKDLARRYDNCAVLRTYSKIGLAGLRLGVLVAGAAIAHEVEKVRPPYNVGVLPQRAGEIALAGFRDEMKRHVATIVEERERLAAALAALPQIEVFPSGANLLLVRVPAAKRVWQALLDASILVRLFDGAPGLDGCLRITVGTPDENRRLVAALQQILATA